MIQTVKKIENKIYGKLDSKLRHSLSPLSTVKEKTEKTEKTDESQTITEKTPFEDDDTPDLKNQCAEIDSFMDDEEEVSSI